MKRYLIVSVHPNIERKVGFYSYKISLQAVQRAIYIVDVVKNLWHVLLVKMHIYNIHSNIQH